MTNDGTDVSRRQFIAATAATGALAGCLNPSDCEMVEKQDSEVIFDDTQVVGAGEYISYSVDVSGETGVNRDDVDVELLVEVHKLSGARPQLIVETDSGQQLVKTGPKTPIHWSTVLDEMGTYHIILRNVALLTAGEWDVNIEARWTYDEEVCE